MPSKVRQVRLLRLLASSAWAVGVNLLVALVQVGSRSGSSFLIELREAVCQGCLTVRLGESRSLLVEEVSLVRDAIPGSTSGSQPPELLTTFVGFAGHQVGAVVGLLLGVDVISK